MEWLVLGIGQRQGGQDRNGRKGKTTPGRSCELSKCFVFLTWESDPGETPVIYAPQISALQSHVQSDSEAAILQQLQGERETSGRIISESALSHP